MSQPDNMTIHKSSDQICTLVDRCIKSAQENQVKDEINALINAKFLHHFKYENLSHTDIENLKHDATFKILEIINCPSKEDAIKK